MSEENDGRELGAAWLGNGQSGDTQFKEGTGYALTLFANHAYPLYIEIVDIEIVVAHAQPSAILLILMFDMLLRLPATSMPEPVA